MGADGVLDCKRRRLFDLDGVLAYKRRPVWGVDGVLDYKRRRVLGTDGVLAYKRRPVWGADGVLACKRRPVWGVDGVWKEENEACSGGKMGVESALYHGCGMENTTRVGLCRGEGARTFAPSKKRDRNNDSEPPKE